MKNVCIFAVWAPLEQTDFSLSCGAIAKINAKSRLSDKQIIQYLFNNQRLHCSTRIQHGIIHFVFMARLVVGLTNDVNDCIHIVYKG